MIVSDNFKKELQKNLNIFFTKEDIEEGTKLYNDNNVLKMTEDTNAITIVVKANMRNYVVKVNKKSFNISCDCMRWNQESCAHKVAAFLALRKALGIEEFELPIIKVPVESFLFEIDKIIAYVKANNGNTQSLNNVNVEILIDVLNKNVIELKKYQKTNKIEYFASALYVIYLSRYKFNFNMYAINKIINFFTSIDKLVYDVLIDNLDIFIEVLNRFSSEEYKRNESYNLINIIFQYFDFSVKKDNDFYNNLLNLAIKGLNSDLDISNKVFNNKQNYLNVVQIFLNQYDYLNNMKKELLPYYLTYLYINNKYDEVLSYYDIDNKLFTSYDKIYFKILYSRKEYDKCRILAIRHLRKYSTSVLEYQEMFDKYPLLFDEKFSIDTRLILFNINYCDKNLDYLKLSYEYDIFNMYIEASNTKNFIKKYASDDNLNNYEIIVLIATIAVNIANDNGYTKKEIKEMIDQFTLVTDFLKKSILGFTLLKEMKRQIFYNSFLKILSMQGI